MERWHIGLPTRALLGANGLLALLVALELVFPARSGNASGGDTDAPQSALPEFASSTAAAPTFSQLADMLERPLFYTDRRLPAPQVEAAPAAPLTPLRLKLEGIAIAGGARVAVLRNLNGNQLIQLAEGDAHDGWTLDAIGSTSVTFSRGAQTSALQLDPDTGARRQ